MIYFLEIRKLSAKRLKTAKFYFMPTIGIVGMNVLFTIAISYKITIFISLGYRVFFSKYVFYVDNTKTTTKIDFLKRIQDKQTNTILQNLLNRS